MAFISPAEDYREEKLDFNLLLATNPAATFSLRMSGSAMEGVGIFDGDIVIVDRSLKAINGSIVVVTWQGEFMIRRLRKAGKGYYLAATQRGIEEIEITGEGDMTLFGVVIWSIRDFKRERQV